jgi:RNA polymerase sigma-70 factor (ECF subfamily)
MRELVTEAQFTELYRSLVDAVYAYASRRSGGQRQLAEDVTQETWLRAVREWRERGVPTEPLAWLTTVARNLLLNQLRQREGVPIETISPAEVLRAVERDDISDSEEIAARVNRALERLPPNEARLLEAFHYERRRVAQLALAYGISERAVEGRLRRARERLRDELELTRPKPEGGVA